MTARTLGTIAHRFALGFGIATFILAAILADRTTAPAQPAPNTDADRVVAMMDAHHCWSGEGPQGVIPGHAVVDTGAGPEYVDSKVGFAIWLDGKPGTLSGFCR
jgi:hypothetical protein